MSGERFSPNPDQRMPLNGRFAKAMRDPAMARALFEEGVFGTIQQRSFLAQAAKSGLPEPEFRAIQDRRRSLMDTDDDKARLREGHAALLERAAAIFPGEFAPH